MRVGVYRRESAFDRCESQKLNKKNGYFFQFFKRAVPELICRVQQTDIIIVSLRIKLSMLNDRFNVALLRRVTVIPRITDTG